MRTTWILPFVLAAVLPACSGSPLPTSPVERTRFALADAAEPAPVTRPLKGTCTTTFPPAPFPPPPVLQQTDTGVCHLSHLGQTAHMSVKEIHFATGTQVTSELRLTAANGDVLLVNGSGTNRLVGPGLVGFEAVMTITGGTGRFQSATGSFRVSGVANLATNTASHTIDGQVTY